MTEPVESPRAWSQRARLALAVQRPWLVYAAALGILALAERIATPERETADRILDVVIQGVALCGLLGAVLGSIAVARRQRVFMGRGTRLVLLALGGLLGPLLGTLVVTAVAHDVDGASWMLFLPVLALIFLPLALLVRAFVDARRGQSGSGPPR